MRRSFLSWFYLGVQFVMLAVSIPKVATLFHAYDPESIGPLLAGIDLRSWLVGLAIDCTATLTTWAAMNRFEESRRWWDLIAPWVIVLACSALSVIANYEDAATLHPAQYAHVALFDQPALLINPLLISAPPILVLLLITLVPSVLAQPRLRSPEEIEARTREQIAIIASEQEIQEARARKSAQVMKARFRGVADALSAIGTQGESVIPRDEPAPESEEEPVTPTKLKAVRKRRTRSSAPIIEQGLEDEVREA